MLASPVSGASGAPNEHGDFFVPSPRRSPLSSSATKDKGSLLLVLPDMMMAFVLDFFVLKIYGGRWSNAGFQRIHAPQVDFNGIGSCVSI